MDGINLLDVVAPGRAPAAEPHLLFFRHGDDRAVLSQDSKLLSTWNSPPQLYQINNDPSESRNVAAQFTVLVLAEEANDSLPFLRCNKLEKLLSTGLAAGRVVELAQSG